MRGLFHPNVTSLVGITQNQRHFAILMEYIPGNNLADILFDRNFDSLKSAFTTENRIAVAEAITQATAYLHTPLVSIIHNDMKPGNIMIYKVTKAAKLCHFGHDEKLPSASWCPKAGGSIT
ncbi:hypothetical protein QAD02_000721 [Eretmocerus hayati]|uniref:Uncharacterized protein n=1 Tax=Eretmocerus hayati TaxID=131215 RepID=A0ACC2NGV5_9HYME|nr:hypothetical protein QAD02_000721 [Eretmocerus hayati]